MKTAPILIAVYGFISASCSTIAPDSQAEAPKRKVEYLGSNTFRWGIFEGRHLVSTIPDFTQHFPTIRSDGVFEQLDARLAVLEKDEIAEVQYSAPSGDILEVDFSQYETEGLVTVTRQRAGILYVHHVLLSTPEGLAIVETTLIPQPDAELSDVIEYGNLYFFGQGSSMEEVEKRFFAAAATAPRLGLTYLEKVFEAASTHHNRTLYQTAEAYRQRFILIQELQGS